MNGKWKKVAQENIESLKNVNPDKANKDQYLLYAASIALLDHADSQIKSVQPESEDTTMEYDGDKSIYNEYIDRKRTYRESKDDTDKQYMLSALEKYMNGLSNELEELIRDADCHEERKTIKKCINKIQSV